MTSLRNSFDLSAYLVLGPDDCKGRPVADVVAAALNGGVTFVQIRAKHADAGEIIQMAREVAQVIADAGKSESVALVIDDRVDVAWAARRAGIKVDGVHVGQSDVPAEDCRALLGDDAIVGLSANTSELFDIVAGIPEGVVDYIGAGAVHATSTKPDCALIDAANDDSNTIALIDQLSRSASYPVVAGGGVKLADIAPLARTHVAGWFVVSAIAGADDPEVAARELVDAWKTARGEVNEGSAS